MSRCLVLAALFASCACAAILPDRFGPYQLQPLEMKGPPIDAQLAEYGAEGSDVGNYGRFSLTVWRFKDPTGAYAASLKLSGVRVGNYLVQCDGKCPNDLAQLADKSLPHVSHAAIPTLDGYLPPKNLAPRSTRYILGSIGLQADAPEIPASAVNFDFGTEGELARYRNGVLLAVFNYPTPSIARQQLPQFEQITGAIAKRTGPLIAIAIGPPSASAKLLDGINYQGSVEADQQPPPKPLEMKPETAGQMILTILSLAGLLLAFCLLSGIAVGGSLWVARRFGYSAAEGSLITLHLEGK